jgi:hypothetical protein
MSTAAKASRRPSSAPGEGLTPDLSYPPYRDPPRAFQGYVVGPCVGYACRTFEPEPKPAEPGDHLCWFCRTSREAMHEDRIARRMMYPWQRAAYLEDYAGDEETDRKWYEEQASGWRRLDRAYQAALMTLRSLLRDRRDLMGAMW